MRLTEDDIRRLELELGWWIHRYRVDIRTFLPTFQFKWREPMYTMTPPCRRP